MDLLGFGLATLALIFFGLYMVPRKLTGLRDLPFAWSMSWGIVLTSSLASYFWHGTPLPISEGKIVLYSLICGPLWYAGVLFYSISVTKMGLVLATPIKNTTAILGTLIGLVAFAEWRETRPVPALMGAVLVVLSAMLISQTGENDCRRSCINMKGVLAAIAAAIFFASYTWPFKMAQQAGADAATLLAYMSWGILPSAALGFALLDRDWGGWQKRPWREHLWAALCGVLWAVATLSMAGAIRRIGLAITWPFTNLNTIVTVCCGIVFFHEINIRKFWRLMLWGIAAGVGGVVLLGIARM